VNKASKEIAIEEASFCLAALGDVLYLERARKMDSVVAGVPAAKMTAAPAE
jgi:hypothetical protein